MPHKDFLMKKLLYSLLLCVPALHGFSSESLLETQSESIFIIAGSDFQAKTPEAGAGNVSRILEKIRSHTKFDADRVLFCGDYTVQLRNLPKDSEDGIRALRKTLSSAQLGIVDNEILLVQGNHDPVGTRGLATSGAQDPDHNRYGVFVINEDDFMWMQSRRKTDGNDDLSDDESTVLETAKKLSIYLDKKYAEHPETPIFVLSHLPLHYSMRTRRDGDGCFAKHIFDVLNRCGTRGQKLIFLYGHNHSNGWDDHLGGAVVFLPPGEKMDIAVPENRKRHTQEEIAFTYMNAGYTGYYTTPNTISDARRRLSMSVFELTANGRIIVRRFSHEGIFFEHEIGPGNKPEEANLPAREN